MNGPKELYTQPRKRSNERTTTLHEAVMELVVYFLAFEICFIAPVSSEEMHALCFLSTF